MVAGTIHIDTVDPVDGQTLRPHPARIQDFLLGGKDNYAHDRQAAAALCAVAPSLVPSVSAGHRFMIRAARYLATAQGIDRYLTVGAGLPCAPDLHDVVQAARPASRVVYVDHDAAVVAHARALLSGDDRGVVGFLRADPRAAGAVVTAPVVQEVLGGDRPVAVIVLSALHVIPDDDEAARLIADLMAPWPPGSAVAICAAWSGGAPAQAAAIGRIGAEQGLPLRFRSLAETRALLGGLELVGPGVVPVHRWFPEDDDRRLRDHQVLLAGAIAVTN